MSAANRSANRLFDSDFAISTNLGMGLPEIKGERSTFGRSPLRSMESHTLSLLFKVYTLVSVKSSKRFKALLLASLDA